MIVYSVLSDFYFFFFFFKQKTAYEMRISDWSSDVCSSDLRLDGVCVDLRWRRACTGGDSHARGRGGDGVHDQPTQRQVILALEDRRGEVEAGEGGVLTGLIVVGEHVEHRQARTDHRIRGHGIELAAGDADAVPVLVVAGAVQPDAGRPDD